MSPLLAILLAALGPLIQALAKKAAEKLMEWLNDLFTRASKSLPADATSDDVFDEAIRLTRTDRKLNLRQRVKRVGMLRLFKAVSPGLLRKEKPTKHDKDEFAALADGFE